MTTAYVDFAYYEETYLGTAIAPADFSRLALRASAVIDQLTSSGSGSRAATVVDADEDATLIDAIQMATCAVAEEYQATEDEGGAAGIQSESVGSLSVTYADYSTRQRTIMQRYTAAAALYLASTGLMYRGFASGEYGGTIDED